MPVLSCSGLSRRFGDVQAVDDVSFSIAEGETCGLLGPNGSGKTTTISMITAVLPSVAAMTASAAVTCAVALVLFRKVVQP